VPPIIGRRNRASKVAAAAVSLTRIIHGRLEFVGERRLTC